MKMTIERIRLHNRRLNETVDLHFERQRYHVTIGYFADGRPGEVFCNGAKIGSGMDLLIDDACVALSMLWQHGAEPMALAHSMGKLGNDAPASIIGALVILVAGTAEATAEGTADETSDDHMQPSNEGRPNG